MPLDFELPAKKVYEAYRKIANKKSGISFTVPWEQLTDQDKGAYVEMARVAQESSPAPLVLELRQIVPYPGIAPIRVFYADITPEAVEILVEEFRNDVLNRIKDMAAR